MLSPQSISCTASLVSPLVSIPELLRLAANGLPQMIDPVSGLFCHTLKKTPDGMMREGVSPRYSLMTLLGLHRYEKFGGQHSVDIHNMLRRMVENTSWINCAGDLGLLLWCCAVVEPELLPGLIERTKLAEALQCFSDGRQRRTMELAWILSGSAHCAISGFQHSDVEAVGNTARSLLIQNRGRSGLFGHLASGNSLVGWLRGYIGTFADQVYPIYAFALHGQATGNTESLAIAQHCAARICQLQGKQGEWWWHYNSQTGGVTSGYPVYSVHQHAMGPMALLALSVADYRQQVDIGLGWIAKCNDLHVDMRDDCAGVIWRNLYQARTIRYVNELQRLLGWNGVTTGLKVNYECRPYELGWLLYALSELATKR